MALSRLGERESGTETLQKAVAAYGEALKEWTRERVPLQWATTQSNLGVALSRLASARADETLQKAVAAYGEALKEWTPEASPYWHDIAQQNRDLTMALVAQRRAK